VIDAWVGNQKIPFTQGEHGGAVLEFTCARNDDAGLEE
jgi:hypothetical protein